MRRHRVVVHQWRTTRQNFEHLRRTHCRNDGVRRSNGRDDVFHHALRELKRHSLKTSQIHICRRAFYGNAVEIRTIGRFFEHPLHVFCIICIEFDVSPFLRPKNLMHVFNTMRWRPSNPLRTQRRRLEVPGRFCEGTHRKFDLRRIKPQRAFETRRHSW